ncbi:unnamed protein product [Chrysoparadoxa australica]
MSLDWSEISPIIFRGAGGAAFVLCNAETWTRWHIVAWIFIIVLGLELVSWLVHLFGRVTASRLIDHRGKHLDQLEPLDIAFVVFNKTLTSLFTFQWLCYMRDAPSGTTVNWNIESIGVASFALSISALYVVYDFFYTVFHRVLHQRWIYRYVHKHHHRQKAPSRGNTDAVNVHPVEFIGGEYNHLLALHLVASYIMPVHAAAAMIFLVAGGFIASLNHTRYDIRAPFMPWLYQVSKQAAKSSCSSSTQFLRSSLSTDNR